MTTVLEPERASHLRSSVGLTTDVATDSAASMMRTEWCLRIGAAACFVGHGAFGILQKEGWVTYFAIFGIERELARLLMPVVGAVDIAAGIAVLVSPRPIVLLYMSIWAAWTALLRPIAGESFFETLERAGNYGVPIVMIAMFGIRRDAMSWLAPYAGRKLPLDRVLMGRLLLWTTATLLFAHGALLAIAQKPSFTTLYAAAGVHATALPSIGWGEMGAAALVLIAPMPTLLIAIAAWKMASEALFPLSGSPIWEFIERGGSYAAPIALVLLHGKSPFTRIHLSRSSR
jgi:hypothetical protein